jgi:hypothetical protein
MKTAYSIPELETTAHWRLTNTIRQVMKESADADAEYARDAALERLLDIEANKILVQIQSVMNSSKPPTAKLEALYNVMIQYDDDDEEGDVTPVTLSPKASV